MLNIFVAPAIIAGMIWWFFGGDFWFWFWTGVLALVAWAVLYFVFKIAEGRAQSRSDALLRQKIADDAAAEEQRQHDDIKRWHEIARGHKDALTLRYRQLVTKDVYGAELLDAWRKELPRFRKSVGIAGREDTVASFDSQITLIVQAWVKAATSSPASAFISGDPVEYERWCAEILRQNGWDASTTKASGGQGVDIIAKKGGRTAAIQCKLYTSGPVGNKAVQEVHAAAGYVDAAHAVVVSSGDYTPSARQLAAKLGVLLLHHSQLPKLEALLPGKEKAESRILLPNHGSGLIIPPSEK
ncbi:hypothetical protein ABID26_004059 [Mesorhizobium shonense]|uniref:Restriction endonuclease type IV Mrr domain-containing protein n=1 Tax=Mesorhizobium shonense TaxID=1209948 RepID=A0ABV2HVL2_9HYPH